MTMLPRIQNKTSYLARLCAFLAFRLWRQAIENVGFDGLAKDIPPCPGPGFGPIKLIGMSAWASLSHINHWNPTTLPMIECAKSSLEPVLKGRHWARTPPLAARIASMKVCEEGQ